MNELLAANVIKFVQGNSGLRLLDIVYEILMRFSRFYGLKSRANDGKAERAHRIICVGTLRFAHPTLANLVSPARGKDLFQSGYVSFALKTEVVLFDQSIVVPWYTKKTSLEGVFASISEIANAVRK